MSSDLSERSRENHTNWLSVMLVDDSEADREVYKRYLKQDLESDYCFIEAETGESAFDLYSQFLPDIILLDYLLPDIDGLEWLNLWQQRNSKLCPVIILTGQGSEEVAVQFIKLGAADYFVKSQITAEKLKLSIGKEIAAQKLRQERKNLIAQLTLTNKKLERSNRQYQKEIIKREKYHEIISNVPAVIYAKNVDSSTQKASYLWLANQEFQKVFAMTESDIVGKTDGELFSPETAEQFAANDRLVIENKQALTTEEKVCDADGNLHTYLSFKFPLLDDGGNVASIVGIATDITEHKQAQIKLLDSEHRFGNTFEQAAVGIAHVAVDGKWLLVNQKLCQIVGYTREELMQTSFQAITHPGDLELDLDRVRQMLSGKISTYSMEKRYLRKDGASIWVHLTVSLVKDFNGKPDYFISFIEDISDRKQLELSQQKSLQRLSNLHQLDRAIVEAQHPQAIANIALRNIQLWFAFRRASIVTFDADRQTANILVTHGQDKAVREKTTTPLAAWQDVIKSLCHSEDYAITPLSQLPHLSAALPSLAALGLNDGICFSLRISDRLLGVLTIWVDDFDTVSFEELTVVSEISQRVAIALQQAELLQTIQTHAQELEQKVSHRTQQLEEINQELRAFSYSISHDLRAPLRAIQGFATALEEDYGQHLDELGKQYTQRLANSAQQMEHLIQDLLTYSRLARTEIQKQQVNIFSIVEKVIKDLDSTIVETKAKIIVKQPLLNVIGNRTILQQIVGNLLSNALKFVSQETIPQITIYTELRGKYVRLWVEDNGIGIEPQYRQRIFQVFERLHGNETYPGTGIGLAIVKKGTERLGGKVSFELASNGGSRFWIELPCE